MNRNQSSGVIQRGAGWPELEMSVPLDMRMRHMCYSLSNTQLPPENDRESQKIGENENLRGTQAGHFRSNRVAASWL